MAKTASEKSYGANTQVGGYVYKPFEIMKPGKVIDICRVTHAAFPEGQRMLKVQWLDGSISEHWDNHLNCFNHATDEHLKKYNKFDALRQKLSKI